MKKPAFLLLILFVLGGCAAPKAPSRAIYAISKQDRYAGANASRDSFRVGETPCIKISGHGGSTFSYNLYKEGLLESVDSGSVNKTGDNEVLTCWKNLPSGFYRFRIYDSYGEYVDTLDFSVGE